jgi:hypothetical protein
VVVSGTGDRRERWAVSTGAAGDVVTRRDLIAGETEHALQTKALTPCFWLTTYQTAANQLVSGVRVAGEDRPGGHRRVAATRHATPETVGSLPPAAVHDAAEATDEPVAPAQPLEVAPACGVVRKPGQQLVPVARVVDARLRVLHHHRHTTIDGGREQLPHTTRSNLRTASCRQQVAPQRHAAHRRASSGRKRPHAWLLSNVALRAPESRAMRRHRAHASRGDQDAAQLTLMSSYEPRQSVVHAGGRGAPSPPPASARPRDLGASWTPEGACRTQPGQRDQLSARAGASCTLGRA